MMEAYDRYHASKAEITYWNISRQYGKSFTGALLATEMALRIPGGKIPYASQDQKACRDIVFQQMEVILKDCPRDLLPEFRSQQGEYYFPHNGSRIRVAGGDDENQARLRGKTAHAWIADELGHTKGNTRNLVYAILMPQTNTTDGRGLVMTSPAESAGHFTTELANLCKSEGAYEEFTIWTNRLVSEDKKRSLLKANGWCDACWDFERLGLAPLVPHTCSTVWQREYRCMFVTDSNNAVVPEFTQEAEKEVVRATPRPEHFDALVCLDGGFTDPAGCLFAHVDYRRAKLVIEDEWVKREVLTADIAEFVGNKEVELWGKSDLFWSETQRRREKCASTLRRVMDIDPEKTYDFKKNHGMDWTPAQKGPGSVQVSANNLNGLIRSRSIEIHPRCVNLIRQLHNATWSGRRAEDGLTPRKTFSRNSTDGHFDLVAALFYVLPFADLAHNPSPPPRHDVNMYYTETESELDESEDALTHAFRNPQSGDDS